MGRIVLFELDMSCYNKVEVMYMNDFSRLYRKMHNKIEELKEPIFIDDELAEMDYDAWVIQTLLKSYDADTILKAFEKDKSLSNLLLNLR